ncbi:MAG TPA: hypothetical protein VH247_10235 [Thermoleophilaceae bacterium]|jgi:hypothetical protein|nr:hypothetical protein [Thermoleophilaceae bacterium]
MTHTKSSKPLRTAIAIAVAASAVLVTIYYYGGVAGQADATPLRAALVGSVGALIAGVAMWRLNRARYEDAAVDRVGRRAAVLAPAAVVSLAGFWIGITVPISAAAFVFGRRSAVEGRRALGYASCAAASVAVAASVVLCVIGAS